MKAFDLADKYRNPACILADGITGPDDGGGGDPRGQPVPFDHTDWAVAGTPETRKNLISSIVLEPDELERHNLKLDAKYKRIEAAEVLYEEYRTEDAELVVVAYGVVSRIVYSTVDQARAKGLKVGLLRPITLWPFPTAPLRDLAARAERLPGGGAVHRPDGRGRAAGGGGPGPGPLLRALRRHGAGRRRAGRRIREDPGRR